MNDPGHRHGTPEDLAHEFPTDNGRPRPLTLKDNVNAVAALKALRAHGQATGQEGRGAETVPEAIADVVADLHHLADALGLDMPSMLETARRHFWQECKAGEEPC